MAFDPREHMMNLKGREYLPVAWRVVWMRDEHPDWTMRKTMLEKTDEFALFRAEILDEEGRLISDGHGSETKIDFPDFIEKAETKALGRALAYMGYGTQFAPELDEGSRIVDTPIRRGRKKAAADPEPPVSDPPPPAGDVMPHEDTVQLPPRRIRMAADAYRCVRCGQPIEDHTSRTGQVTTAAELVERSLSEYGKVYCVSCARLEKEDRERYGGVNGGT